MKIRLAAVVLCSLALMACGQSTDRVVVAAGTTLVDSGLVDSLAARYEAENPGIQLSIVAEPTALALELARQGAADLILVHAPDLERRFVADGLATTSRPVVTSRFVLLGPSDLAAGFGGKRAPEVFGAIAEQGISFASRADGSGTYETETEIWKLAKVDPVGTGWYIETGQGMGPTIQVADQKKAATLSEYGVFLAAADSVEIVDLMVDPEGLTNPYTGHVVAGGENVNGAAAFLEWLVSPEGAAAILEANQALFGEIVYQPASS